MRGHCRAAHNHARCLIHHLPCTQDILLRKSFQLPDGTLASPLDHSEVRQLVSLYQLRSPSLPITMRELVKVVRRKVVLGTSLAWAAHTLLAPRLPQGSDSAVLLLEQLCSIEGWGELRELSLARDYTVEQRPGRKVAFAAGEAPKSRGLS